MKIQGKVAGLLAATLILMVNAGVALAQPPQGGPPPGGERGGFGGPGGERGPGGRFQPRPLTAGMVPAETLDFYLNLTDAQAQKIQAINEKMRAQMPRPPQGGPGGQGRPGGQGGPEGQGGGQPPQMPSQKEMDDRRAKMESVQKQATTQINAVLTPAQKQKLPGVLKALSSLRRTGLDLRAAPKLKLTDAQMTKLAGLGEQATPEKLNAILTTQQRSVVAANQRRGPGGMGRPGGPGGPGGPPPAGP